MNDLALIMKALDTTAEELRQANDLKSCFVLEHLRRNIELHQSRRANAKHQAEVSRTSG